MIERILYDPIHRNENIFQVASVVFSADELRR